MDMAQPSSSSNLHPSGQPMPRMTDSMTPSQAGPGPSSFKLAALSAQSYHLDSPPFTGTAGPLGEVNPPLNHGEVVDRSSPNAQLSSAESDYENRSRTHKHSQSQTSSITDNNSIASSSAAAQSGGEDNAERTPFAGASTNLAFTGRGSSTSAGRAANSRQNSDERRSRGGISGSVTNLDGAVSSVTNQASDVDVPQWSLDESRRTKYSANIGNDDTNQGDRTISADGGDITPGTDLRKSFNHLHSSSLSPPPFSSSGPGPIGTSQNKGGSNEDITLSTSGQKPRIRELSRPTFTQTSYADAATSHMEDAASSATGDADNNGNGHGGLYDEDQDADADDNIHPPDGEVDGDDERPFVSQNGRNTGPQKKMPLQSQTQEHYKFPRHRLPTRMRNESKIPLVIVACGSFSPPTYLHLRIFEMAKDQVIESGKYELLGGYYSPVSDYYKKEGLAKATHRVRMCELAVEKTSTWLMVDAWESLQDEYQRTAVVLDHFDDEINGGPEGGILTSDGSRRRIRVMLLAGGDLIQSMGEPGVWADVDLHHILGKYGCMIVERTGADVWSFLLSHDLLWRYRKNLKIVKQTIFNDISSSKVRLFVRRGQSIKYLLPNSVIHYIEQHHMYRLPEELDTEPPDADLQHF
ncbi:hypothetical protein L7F22_009318 [Adiantum nelumboides]|nr:hypothetical protein [Adiantum nelumboides]